jgi:hypothetical protein
VCLRHACDTGEDRDIQRTRIRDVHRITRPEQPPVGLLAGAAHVAA